MMSEQERADALAEQLDALFAGETMAGDLPDELSDLVEVAQEIRAAAPRPRPEATAALKASLEETMFGNGTPPLNGASSFGPVTPLVIIAALVGLTMLGLLVGWVAIDDPPLPEATSPGSTSQAIEPGVSPPAPAATGEPAPLEQLGDSLMTPVYTPSATIILDILPPLIATTEATLDATTIEITLPGDLVPGQPEPSGDDGEDRGGDGRGGGRSGGGDDNDDDDDD